MNAQLVTNFIPGPDAMRRAIDYVMHSKDESTEEAALARHGDLVESIARGFEMLNPQENKVHRRWRELAEERPIEGQPIETILIVDGFSGRAKGRAQKMVGDWACEGNAFTLWRPAQS